MLIAELYAPPEVLDALRDGRRQGRWIRAYCPYCDPRRRKRRSLAASPTGFGRKRDRPGWLCHSCHAEKEWRGTRHKGRIVYDPEAIRMDQTRRREQALEVLERSRSIEPEDPIDRYLRRRNLTPLGAFWPSSLRKAWLKHPEGGRFHAMVAVVTGRDNTPIGVHRTFLTEDGEKAPVRPNRLSLGPIKGGAVRLGIDSPSIVVAEGIESALAAARALGHGIPWSTLSAPNMPVLSLPRSVDHVVIVPDRDSNGVGYKAAFALRKRLLDVRAQRREIRVKLVYPPRGRSDFADVG